MTCLLNDFSQITAFGVLGLKTLVEVGCVQWCEEGKECVHTRCIVGQWTTLWQQERKFGNTNNNTHMIEPVSLQVTLWKLDYPHYE